MQSSSNRLIDKLVAKTNHKHKISLDHNSTMLFLLQHQLLYRMYHPLSQFHYNPALPMHSNTHHSSLIQPNPSPLRLTFHRQWESNPTPISRILTSPSPTYSTHLLLLLRLPVRIRPRPFTTNLSTSPLLDFNHRPRSFNRRRWSGLK